MSDDHDAEVVRGIVHHGCCRVVVGGFQSHAIRTEGLGDSQGRGVDPLIVGRSFVLANEHAVIARLDGDEIAGEEIETAHLTGDQRLAAHGDVEVQRRSQGTHDRPLDGKESRTRDLDRIGRGEEFA